MRFRTLLFFVFVSAGLFAQQKRYTLKVKADDKISLHGFTYWSELKVSSKDTSFYYPLHAQNPDVLKGLKAGDYTVRIASVFDTRISKKVTLQKNATLKFSGLNKVYANVPQGINLSEKIKLNDTLHIVYSTKGNDITLEKIGITKGANGYTILRYQGLTNDIIANMLFQPEQLKYVTEFETTARSKNSPKAETALTAEVYSLELNRELETFVIPGEWHGLDRLKAILFAIQR